MKRILALVLIATLLFSFSACGKKITKIVMVNQLIQKLK